jgi:hypothetical protein
LAIALVEVHLAVEAFVENGVGEERGLLAGYEGDPIS